MISHACWRQAAHGGGGSGGGRSGPNPGHGAAGLVHMSPKQHASGPGWAVGAGPRLYPPSVGARACRPHWACRALLHATLIAPGVGEQGQGRSWGSPGSTPTTAAWHTCRERGGCSARHLISHDRAMCSARARGGLHVPQCALDLALRDLVAIAVPCTVHLHRFTVLCAVPAIPKATARAHSSRASACRGPASPVASFWDLGSSQVCLDIEQQRQALLAREQPKPRAAAVLLRA